MITIAANARKGNLLSLSEVAEAVELALGEADREVELMEVHTPVVILHVAPLES